MTACYVTHNPHVTGGLTWGNVGWAFRTGYASNWHPLTWLSHMLDAELYGLKPGGHHLTNLLLHTANAVLLFLLLRRLTRAEWRSGLVAGLFALHPLHVESVAWVAERKDVLSAFFFLLTLGAYAAYVSRVEGRGESKCEVRSPKSERRPKAEGRNPKEVQSPRSKVQSPESREPDGESWKCGGGPMADVRSPGSEVTQHAARSTHRGAFWYVLALVFFALGLMSKAMLVTTPFVLLLLDFWPLGRFRLPAFSHGAFAVPQDSFQGSELKIQNSKLKLFAALLLEKVPFFCLTIGASVVTFLVQEKGHAMLMRLPLGARLANAVASYCKYLGKTFWPVDLAVFYPHPETRYPVSQQWPAWVIMAGALLLAGLSVCARLGARRRPWAVTGWFWYLGTLVPVIGIVQIGGQAMADRYTYIPLIGVFVCIAWGVGMCAGGHPDTDPGAPALAGFERPGFTRVSEDRGHLSRLKPALRGPCREALAARIAVGGMAVLALIGCAAATRHQARYRRNNFMLFEHALSVTPDNAPAHFELGCAVGGQGDFDKAIEHFRAALRADPSYVDAYYSLGLTS